jgi:glycerol-3-phosphate dehydrogenase
VKRDLDLLSKAKFDLVILGGGAFGCCAAWEAASRGLSVALLEKSDFCGATSANHLKMVHGGIRYLQHLDFPRVRESMRERAALLRVAPHLVQPLPIVMPTYGRGMEGRLVLRAGLKLYDAVTIDRNRGIDDPDRRIPAGRILSREECLELYPGLSREGLTGAGLFHDGQYYNPPRLALAFLRSAVDEGAVAANYVEATGFLLDGKRVRGVRARDTFTGDELEVRSRVVLNACGPWSARLLRESIGIGLPVEPTFSRDTGFVVRGRRTGDAALACRISIRDPDALLSRHGRHVFLVPWRDHTLVGVWHKVHTDGPDSVEVAGSELRSFLDDVNTGYPFFGLRPEDITMVYAGLTLFGENRPGARDLSFGKRSLLLDHARADGVEGLVTLIGVRATTARGMSEKAIGLVAAKADRKIGASRTEERPVHGGDIGRFDDFLRRAQAEHADRFGGSVVESLVRNHGSAYGRILDRATEDPGLEPILPGSTTLGAEVVHAVRDEMACRLADIAFRRTELASGGDPGDEALRACAELAGAELGWDTARIEAELEAVRAEFPAGAR